MSTPHADDRSFAFDGLAAAVLDGDGSVLRWTAAAEALTGRSAGEVCGRPLREVVAEVESLSADAADERGGLPTAGRLRFRVRSGGTADVAFRAVPLQESAEFLLIMVSAHRASDQDQGVSLLHALLSQQRLGIGLLDTDLAIVRANGMCDIFGEHAPLPRSQLSEALAAPDLESILRRVLETGEAVVRRDQQVRPQPASTRTFGLSLSAFRLEDAHGHPSGVAAMFFDTTGQLRARRHIDLVRESALRVGGSLDVGRTAQQIADLLVPAFGDLAAVDLAEAVLEGDEPSKQLGGGDLRLRNAGMAPAGVVWPAGIQRGDAVPPLPDRPQLRRWQHGETIVLGRDDVLAALDDPRLVEFLIPEAFHSVMLVPLQARGLTLGNVSIWRVGASEAYTADDVDLMTQIGARGALAIDNARRYTREHRAAVALQQRLLPPATTDTAAAETAGVYRPAGGGAEISGDWFDAIALPSFRVAFVAGDVVGHGLHASATMGRLRAAIHTLSDLELEPDELLARVADLVRRIAAEAPPALADTVGATCVYAVYDPVTRCCTIASAGHPPPIMVHPDGSARILSLSVGPPLAVDGMPYETTVVDVAPGSVLALYTDGLIEGQGLDLDEGMQRLTNVLAESCRPDRPLTDAAHAVLDGRGAQPPRDDIALLLARTRAVPAENIAQWQFAPEPAAVANIRNLVARQLRTWGLEELSFTTELVVSELVTNAIRYGRPPADLRLVRHHDVLACEVTDSSSTQPRLRRAQATDEGGRGLFLVAQLTTRWGCRYGQNRKTIWTEQPIKD